MQGCQKRAFSYNLQKMKALWESLAESTRNLTLSTLPCWNPSFRFLTRLCSHGPYNVFWAYSQISSAQMPICVSTAGSSLDRDKPSPQVLKPSVLPYWSQHITHQGDWGGTKKRPKKQKTKKHLRLKLSFLVQSMYKF